MSNRWGFLLPAPLPKRFSLATLLIFVAIVCLAIGKPRLTWSLVVAGLYALVGMTAIACGWRAKRYRVAIRAVSLAFGATMFVAAVWLFIAMLTE